MTFGGKKIPLTLLILFLAGLFVTGGSIYTALADTFGSQRWISALGIIAGGLKMAVAAFVNEFGPVSSSTPAAAAPPAPQQPPPQGA